MLSASLPASPKLLLTHPSLIGWMSDVNLGLVSWEIFNAQPLRAHGGSSSVVSLSSTEEKVLVSIPGFLRQSLKGSHLYPNMFH